MRRKTKQPLTTGRADWVILLLTLILLSIGLVAVLDASIIEAFYQFSDKYHFVKNQAIWMLVGLGFLLITARIPLKTVQMFSRPFFIFALILLVVVLIPGVGSKLQGARRWINLGGFSLQPSEIIKLAVVMYFPTWLISKPQFQTFIGLMIGIVGLLMLEPDLGTSLIIIGIAFTLYYVSGAPIKQLVLITAGGFVISLSLILISPYRRSRLDTFLDPSQDPLGASYHIRQVLISLGSGGVFGTGIGRSRQKFQFLPEATTDSIFAVIAEEAGFLGAIALVGLFLIFITRAFKTTTRIPPGYPHLVAVGVIAWITTQTLLNLAAMVSLVPLTGVPLPFISYGGTSLVAILTATGLLLNTSQYRQV